MKKLFLMCIFLLLGGCAALQPYEEQSMEGVAQFANTYCVIYSQDVRMSKRAQLSELLNPGVTLEIGCPYDE